MSDYGVRMAGELADIMRDYMNSAEAATAKGGFEGCAQAIMSKYVVAEPLIVIKAFSPAATFKEVAGAQAALAGLVAEVLLSGATKAVMS